MTLFLENKTILLVISGGIAAYKSLETIRLIKKAGGRVRVILTHGGAQFVTPLSVSALSGESVYTDLWSLKDETEMGHIRLSREADLILIAPASANIIAQMSCGLAQDLATTTLLAASSPIMIAPAMNHHMWAHPATRSHIETLQARGVHIIPPTHGDMACGETGTGRMAEPEDILKSLHDFFVSKPLKGLKALVTSGPTFEPLDPVRFIGNRSSGKQGHAIAAELAAQGADVTLITGPVSLPDPVGVKTIHIDTAEEMLSVCQSALPVDIAVCAAAVSDWRPTHAQDQKIKKNAAQAAPTISLTENPDILHTLSTHAHRPRLVIGFAAETNDMQAHAREKRARKGCDWILANNIALDTGEKVFGHDQNHVYFFSSSEEHDWGLLSKKDIARKLTQEVVDFFKHEP